MCQGSRRECQLTPTQDSADTPRNRRRELHLQHTEVVAITDANSRNTEKKSVEETSRNTLSKHLLHPCPWSTHNQLPDPGESKSRIEMTPWRAASLHAHLSTLLWATRARRGPGPLQDFHPNGANKEKWWDQPQAQTCQKCISYYNKFWIDAHIHTHTEELSQCTHLFPPTKTIRDLKGGRVRCSPWLSSDITHSSSPGEEKMPGVLPKKNQYTPHPSKKPNQTPKNPKPNPDLHLLTTNLAANLAPEHGRAGQVLQTLVETASSPSKDLKSGFKASSLCQYRN